VKIEYVRVGVLDYPGEELATIKCAGSNIPKSEGKMIWDNKFVSRYVKKNHDVVTQVSS
jgi:hypothetical protein